MVRSRARQWTTRVGRRARRARSAVAAPFRQLGHNLWQRAPVRRRRPGTPRVGPTRLARNGPVTLAYDVRGRGLPLVLIRPLGRGTL
jgi:hypothetical protein